MTEQRDPASFVWDLLYVAGMVPELEALSVKPSGGGERVPAIDKSIGPQDRTNAALKGILGSVRSGPAQLDPVQNYVNKACDLDMDAVAKPEDRPLLHGNEIAKAVMALIDIEAKGIATVDAAGTAELARWTANSPTLDEIVPPPGPGAPGTGDEDGDAGASIEPSDEQLNDAVATYQRRSDAAKRLVVSALRHCIDDNVTSGAQAFAEAEDQEDIETTSDLGNTKLEEMREVLEGCNNLTVIMPDGREAARIFTRYTTDDPVSSFIWPANPTNWPAANEYKLFRGMEPSAVTDLTALKDPLHRGYTANALETVMISGLVETELAIRFFVEGAHSPVGRGVTQKDEMKMNPGATFVGMSFDLARNGDGKSDGNIDVDFGYLHVERMSNGRTEVKAQKTVRFTESDNAPSGYACLLGWLTSMKSMNSVEPRE
jgi:hypothetical protein